MLSKKTQYAFQALMYLAEKGKDEPVLIAEIAKKKKIPLKFLENILLELKNAGVLESKKGKGGGYFFAKNPKDVPLAQPPRREFHATMRPTFPRPPIQQNHKPSETRRAK